MSLILTGLLFALAPAWRSPRAAVGRAALTGAALLLLAAAASADPIRVTSGQLTIPDDEPGGFQFFGPGGFALVEHSGGSQFILSSPRNTCFQVACTSGTRLDLSAVVGGPSPLTPFRVGFGVADINGQHFFTPNEPGLLIGTLRFDAPTIVLPPVEQVPNGVAFSVPFVFHGDITAFAPDDLEATTPIFHLNLVGEGTLGIGLLPFGTRYGEVDSVYTFAATTEPSSIVLTTTALLGLVRRRRAAVPQGNAVSVPGRTGSPA